MTVVTKLFAIDAPKSATEGLQEKFSTLFPSIPLMLATIIAFAICFGFLFFFLYRPVRKMIAKRQQFIQKNIDDAISYKQESLDKLNLANDNLKNSHKQSDMIINNAKIKAEKVIDRYTKKAKDDARRLIEETNLDIQAQQREFDKNSKKYITEVAVELANKILKREISKSTQQEIIDEFLKDNSPIEDI